MTDDRWEQNSSSNVRVLKFGCKPPTINYNKIREQLYAANTYYNKCVELEYERINQYRSIRSKFFPKLAALEEQDRKFKPQRDAIIAEIKEISKRIKDINRQLKNITPKVDVNKLKAEQKQLQEKKKQLSSDKKKLSIDKEEFGKLKKLASEQLESGDEAFKHRMNGAKTTAAAKLAPELFSIMVEEPEWSDWWKEKTANDRAFIEAEHEIRRQATYGELKNHEGKIVAAIGDGVYNESARFAKQAWKDYYKLLRDPIVDSRTKVKAVELGHPRFHRFDGSGQIGVQIQTSAQAKLTNESEYLIRGTKVELIVFPKFKHGELSQSKKISLVPATPNGKRQQRLSQQPGWGVVRIKFGSEGKNKPDTWWAEFPVYVHRRLPTDAIIKHVKIMVKRKGPGVFYQLQLTLSDSQFKISPRGKGVACVNFGWRSLKDGSFRVAYLLDDQGHRDTLVLPHTNESKDTKVGDYNISDRLLYKDDLKSFNDTHFNQVKEILQDYIKTNKKKISKKLLEATEHIEKWRAHRKLRKACAIVIAEFGITNEWWGLWKDERLSVGKDLFASFDEISKWCIRNGARDESKQLAIFLDFWMKKQSHLYTWQENQGSKAINHRRWLFNNWIKSTIDKYQFILVDNYDLRQIKSVCKKEEEEDRQTKRARKNRKNCAPGEARNMMISKGGSKIILDNIQTESGEDFKPGEGPSQRCTKCGRPSQADLREQVMVDCDCGHVEDQDLRNCTNRLREFLDSDFYKTIQKKDKEKQRGMDSEATQSL